MKNINKKVVVFTQFVSLLPLIWISIIFRIMRALITGATESVPNGASMVHGTITMSATHWSLLLAFLTLFASVVINAVVGLGFLIKKKDLSKKEHRYLRSLLFFSGFISSTSILMVKMSKEKKTAENKTSLLVKISSGLIALSPLSLMIMSMKVNNIDKPYYSTNVLMSVEKDKENLVEIFTDGLDWDYATPSILEHQEDLKDFFVFKNAVTQGFNTYTSFKSEMGGFENNVANFSSINNKIPNNATTMIKNVGNLLEMVKPANLDDEKFYVENSHSVIEVPSFAKGWSGEPEIYNRYWKNAEITNWGGARKSTSSGIFNFSSPEPVYYNHLINYSKAKEENSSQKGSFIFLTDNSTHAPIFTSAKGHLSFNSTPETDVYKNIFDNYANYFNKLRGIKSKTTGITAYDNSLIVIFGDHSSHKHFKPNPQKIFDENINLEKNRTFVMIKFPHITKSSFTTEENPFYTAYLQNVVKEYFNNRNSFDPNTFFATNKNFAMDRNFLTFSSSGSFITSSYDWNHYTNKNIIGGPDMRRPYFHVNLIPDKISDKDYQKYWWTVRHDSSKTAGLALVDDESTYDRVVAFDKVVKEMVWN